MQTALLIPPTRQHMARSSQSTLALHPRHAMCTRPFCTERNARSHPWEWRTRLWTSGSTTSFEVNNEQKVYTRSFFTFFLGKGCTATTGYQADAILSFRDWIFLSQMIQNHIQRLLSCLDRLGKVCLATGKPAFVACHADTLCSYSPGPSTYAVLTALTLDGQAQSSLSGSQMGSRGAACCSMALRQMGHTPNISLGQQRHLCQRTLADTDAATCGKGSDQRTSRRGEAFYFQAPLASKGPGDVEAPEAKTAAQKVEEEEEEARQRAWDLDDDLWGDQYTGGGVKEPSGMEDAELDLPGTMEMVGMAALGGELERDHSLKSVTADGVARECSMSTAHIHFKW